MVAQHHEVLLVGQHEQRTACEVREPVKSRRVRPESDHRAESMTTITPSTGRLLAWEDHEGQPVLCPRLDERDLRIGQIPMSSMLNSWARRGGRSAQLMLRLVRVSSMAVFPAPRGQQRPGSRGASTSRNRATGLKFTSRNPNSPALLSSRDAVGPRPLIHALGRPSRRSMISRAGLERRNARLDFSVGTPGANRDQSTF